MNKSDYLIRGSLIENITNKHKYYITSIYVLQTSYKALPRKRETSIKPILLKIHNNTYGNGIEENTFFLFKLKQVGFNAKEHKTFDTNN